MNIYKQLQSALEEAVVQNNLNLENIIISSKSLTAQEAIGDTKRKDFPIIMGKEIMLEAEFRGAKGQAFTSTPAIFKGTLNEIMQLDIENNNFNRGLFISSLNAVMRYLKRAEATIHCKNDQPELCAKKFPDYIKTNYGNPKIALIGFQPAILDSIKDYFSVRVLDLNPETVGTVRYNIMVEDGGANYESALKWADLILCTGSTLCNGSIVNFMNLDKPVLFYGTTLAGAAPILGLKRICFYGS